MLHCFWVSHYRVGHFVVADLSVVTDEFLLELMGVFAVVSLSPPLTPAKQNGAYVWRGRGGGGQICFETFLIKFLAISGDSKHFFWIKNSKPRAKFQPLLGEE